MRTQGDGLAAVGALAFGLHVEEGADHAEKNDGRRLQAE
jgi:hypothetical protein